MTNHITVIGSINQDHILSTPRLPQPGETLALTNTATAAGGKGANQAVAAAKAGAKVNFIGATGADEAGKAMRQALATAGIDIAGVNTTREKATGQAYILLQAGGENSILIEHGANHTVTPRVIATHAGRIKRADIVIAQCEVPLSAIRAGFNLAHDAGKLTLLNPAPAPKVLSPSLLAVTDVIVPNATESATLTGIAIDDTASLAANAAWFHERGVKTVIITLGDQGAYVSQRGRGHLLPAYSVKAVDTTAAGDTFIGALAAKLAPDLRNLLAAVDFAMAASALAVQQLGAQPSIPTVAAITDFLASTKKPLEDGSSGDDQASGN